MSDDEADLRKPVADFLFKVGRDLFARGTVKDAVAWQGPGNMRAAWIMDPKKIMAAGVGHDVQMPFRGAYVGAVLRRHGVRNKNWDYEGEMVMGDFLPRLQNDLYEIVDEPFDITIIPEPGYPWPAPDGYYSAKLGHVVRSERPAWLYPENIVDPSRDVDSPGVNLCELFQPPLGGEIGAEVVEYGSQSDDFFIVTHAMGTIEGMTRYGSVEGIAGWEENAQKVIDCGGLLFPSMAIGPIPSTNFGVGVLIADAGIVLNSLKPRLKRGVSPLSAVYSSDAWTGRTGDFFNETAILAFEQLHGLSDYIYYNEMNIWPLGAPRAWSVSGPGSQAEEIDKATTLKKKLKERFQIWTRDLSPEETEAVIQATGISEARYGYLEAKVNGVMAMSEFPMAAVPPQQEVGFRRFLDMTGFEGELVVVDLPDELFEVMNPDWDPSDTSFDRKNAIRAWANMQYGWHVADAVRERGRTVKL